MSDLRVVALLAFMLGIVSFAIWETILSFQASNCTTQQQERSQQAPNREGAAAQQQGQHGDEKSSHKPVIEPFICTLAGLPTAIRVFMNNNEGFVVGGFTLVLAFITAWLVWATLGLRESTDRLWDAGERQIKLSRSVAAVQAGAGLVVAA